MSGVSVERILLLATAASILFAFNLALELVRYVTGELPGEHGYFTLHPPDRTDVFHALKNTILEILFFTILFTGVFLALHEIVAVFGG